MQHTCWKHLRRATQALLVALVLLASASVFAEEYDDEYDEYGDEVSSLEFGVLGPSAESFHDQALEIANTGDLKRALPLFQKAADLSPTHETYQSNLGLVCRVFPIDPFMHPVHIQTSTTNEHPLCLSG